MFGSSCPCRNFFPLGRKSGPLNASDYLPPPSFSHKLWDLVRPNKSVSRRELLQECEHCRYIWSHDRLLNWCPMHPWHTKAERWYRPDWIMHIRNPKHSFKQLRTNVHPRTGAWISDEASRSKHNEPRTVGISSRAMHVLKDRAKLAVNISGLSGYRRLWKVKFPWPS